MAVRSKNSGFLAWLAGSDVFSHRLALLFASAGRLLLAYLVTFAFLAFVISFFLADPQQREIWRSAVISFPLDLFFMGSKPVELLGTEHPASTIAAATWFGEGNLPMIEEAMSRLYWTLTAALIASLTVFGVGGVLFYGLGKKIRDNEFLRGQELVDTDRLDQIIEERERTTKSPLKIANVHIPNEILARNILTVGSMGTGKSQAINQLIEDARAWGKKMVIYDRTGEFTKKFYRDGKDVILNPVDERCADWSAFRDIRENTDPAMISRFFVKENPKSADPVWDNAARMLLEDLLVIASKTGKTMAWIEQVATRSTLEELHELLLDHNAASTGVINPNNSRGAESVRLTLTSAPAIRFFRYFDSQGTFSVRDFISSEGDGCLFVTSSATHHEAVKPFASAWIETALSQIMSEEPIHGDVRCLFFYDELASLSKLTLMQQALTEARKFGVVSICGIQNLSQLDEIYGKDLTHTFIGNLQTKLVLRVEEYDSAKRLSHELGQEEIAEVAENTSFGIESIRDGSSLNTQRSDRALVTPDEIKILPDLTGFLKIAGDYPIAKIEYDYKPREDVAESLVKKPGLAFESQASDSTEKGPSQGEQAKTSGDKEQAQAQAETSEEQAAEVESEPQQSDTIKNKEAAKDNEASELDDLI